MIPNSFIPVRVAIISKKLSKSESGEVVDSYVQQFLDKDSGTILRDTGSNIDYILKNDMSEACFWMRDEQVFVQMENDAELFSDQMISDKFCYKGVLVRNKTIKNRKTPEHKP